MGFYLTKVVSELRERISVRGQAKAGEDGVMDISRAPAVELRATVQQHLHQPHHARVLDLDAGDFGFAGWNRLSDFLK
jgi:hypothetical protein